MKTTIMKRMIYVLAALASVVLTGCDARQTPQQLLDQDASGVVMVLNSYYYELTLPNGEQFYFKGLDEDGDLEGFTADREEAEKNPAVATGTGFFVGSDGAILTNRHVAEPMLDNVQAKEGMRRILDALKSLAELAVINMSAEYSQLEDSKLDCISYYYDYWGDLTYSVDEEQLSQINRQQTELESEISDANDFINAVNSNSNPEGYRIRVVSRLGIAYNDTYVSGVDDFLQKNPCVVVRTASEADTDLALISLKNKHTPEGKHVFTLLADDGGNWQSKLARLFDGDDDEPHTGVGSSLHMIGYNAGPAIAATRQGIKAQITSGRVTQASDGERLLYDLAAMQGSSGSPVVDDYGNLVAVNFAKTNGSDNFNLGIPLPKIKAFMGW